MMSRTTLVIRAGMSNVIDDLRNTTEADATHAVAEALDNIDWPHFDGMTDDDLCGHAGHDFDASSCGTVCYHCGAERSRTNGGIA